MKETAETLGGFVAKVLSTITAATYVPAAVIVGAGWLIVAIDLSGGSDPVKAMATFEAPGFAALASFTLIVMVVAAVLDPVQFWVTRLAEGYTGIRPLRSLLIWNQRRIRRRLDSRRYTAAIRTTAIKKLLLAEGLDVVRRRSLERERDRLEAKKKRLSASMRRFPDDERLLGTRLGNRIRAYEDQANEELRARAEALPGNGEIQDLIPFAAFAIPELTYQQHGHFRSQLQCMSTLMLVVPLATIGLAVVIGGTSWRIGVVVVGALVTASCHAGARSAGDGYGTMLLAIARQFAYGGWQVPVPREGNAPGLAAVSEGR